MQILGLAESTPRTESRWRALFWPTIRNETDFGYVTRQGFWICFFVSVLTLFVGAITGSAAAAVFEAAFFFLAAVGVRERSRTAAVAAFAAYLLSGLVMQRYGGNGFGIARIIFLALLFANIRGSWKSAAWPRTDPEAASPRLSQTFGDRIVNRVPAVLWPRTRYLFYVLAVLEILILLVALFVPLGAPAPADPQVTPRNV